MNFNQQKLALVDALLPLCPFLAIDATQPGVEVPSGLNRNDLVLRIGRDPRVMGMPDLTLDERGFRATISTQGVRHFVVVPWQACSRCWVGEPFQGPLVIWPDDAKAATVTPVPAATASKPEEE
jgi:stringent starvation protein B